MPEHAQPDRGIELAPGVFVAAGDARFTFSRSSGPGGQAVNKLSTRARLRVPVEAIRGLSAAARDRLRKLAGRRLTGEDVLVLVASGTRSQLDNRRACIERLRRLVTAARTAPKKRKRTKPSKAARERRLEGKRRVGKKKEARRKPEPE